MENPDPVYLDLAVELLPNPFGATLSGTLQQYGRIDGGVPTFTDLRVHGIGTGLALRVTSSPGIEAATTGPFSTLPVPANPDLAFWGPFTLNGKLLDWGQGGIHVMNEDGSGAVRITLGGERPAWSPDGRKLLFGRNPRLFVLDLDESSEMVLCDNCYGGRWSPDGARIAFSRRIDGGAEFPGPARIHVLSIDGAVERVLSPPDICAGAPSFAPDGNRILFMGCDDDAGIYTMDADGDEVIRLTALAAWFPSYSPDGSTIVFEYSDPDQLPAIWIIGADGSGLRRLTNGMDFDPAWSPDGSRVAFTRYVPSPDVNNQQPYIHTMNPDGTGVRRVSLHPARMPSWRPSVAQP
jgi:Tol biopolymer transport system component